VGERERHADEMRPVTVLFADIVGSTALGERLGPDEVKVLVGEFVTRMSRCVEDFGGLVQAYLGDGVCAYFGVPVAHEDDPERAARAALRIVGDAADYAAEVEAAWGIGSFGVRIGLNSGPAGVGVVGESSEQTVALGDTTNVAARLQSFAEPGTIAVGPGTASRLSARFVLESLGSIAVKGRGEPVSSSRLIGPRPASEPRPGTPLVGRERELGRLRVVVADLVAGRGQVLLLVGDVGLGTTRMLHELRTLAGDDVSWFEARCSSFGGARPYGPFVDVLRTWIGGADGEAELAVRTKLRARGEALLGPRWAGVLPYLAILLGLQLGPDAERDLLGLSADELAAGQRDAFAAWAEAVAAGRPLVLAVDDLHWADRPTRTLAERLLGLTDRAAVLLAVTMRPDTASEGWAFRVTAQRDFSHRAEEIALAPLDPVASGRLIDALVPPGLLGDEVREELVAKAEGNPLFVEELVRALMESGGERRRTWTITPGAAGELPPALEALLVTRIDRLDPGARRVAQAAAVVGREFPASLATAVAESEDPDRDVGALLRAGIVREVHRFPELECTFRHGLLQEAALSTLTTAALRTLSGRVGRELERRYGDRVDDHLERIAYHFYRSDEPGRALEYLERAADRAVDGAHAATLLDRARRLAGRIGDAPAESRLAERLRGSTP
jgi:class 3 adenylate cyclase